MRLNGCVPALARAANARPTRGFAGVRTKNVKIIERAALGPLRRERPGPHMRIITGQARGRRLQTLPGEDTRPTAGRVKEALFSALQFELEGRRVLDLFAGCGQLGIEALSRGAQGCVFVDRNPEAVEVIRQNLKAAGLTANTQVLCQDAASYLTRHSDRFDIAFLDPPYAAGLLEPMLERVVPFMNKGGVIVCESGDKLPLPEQSGGFRLDRTYRYGKTLIRLYRHRAD